MTFPYSFPSFLFFLCVLQTIPEALTVWDSHSKCCLGGHPTWGQGQLHTQPAAKSETYTKHSERGCPWLCTELFSSMTFVYHSVLPQSQKVINAYQHNSLGFWVHTERELHFLLVVSIVILWKVTWGYCVIYAGDLKSKTGWGWLSGKRSLPKSLVALVQSWNPCKDVRREPAA